MGILTEQIHAAWGFIMKNLSHHEVITERQFGGGATLLLELMQAARDQYDPKIVVEQEKE